MRRIFALSLILLAPPIYAASTYLNLVDGDTTRFETNDLAPHIAIIAEGASLKELAFHRERRGLCGDEGVSDPTAIGVVGFVTRHF